MLPVTARAVVSHGWRKLVALTQNIKGREGEGLWGTGLGDQRQIFWQKASRIFIQCTSVTVSVLSGCMKFEMMAFLHILV